MPMRTRLEFGSPVTPDGMNESSPLSLKATCPHCAWSELAGMAQCQRWLGKLGFLRRNANPTSDEVRELTLANAHQIECPECESTGLSIAPYDPAEDSWDAGKACESCGEPIDADRLEIFPDSHLCVTCQQDHEQGRAPRNAPTYCPVCGSLMEVRSSGSRGLTRYELVCGNYPRCRGKG